MLPVIESRRVRLAELCRRMDVKRLELFGSAARGDFDPERSDLDFLVEFDDATSRPALAVYFDLKDELEALFGRHVDLVMPAAVRNPFVQADIDRTRQLVYAA